MNNKQANGRNKEKIGVFINVDTIEGNKKIRYLWKFRTVIGNFIK
jgi:hypothetical protein